MIDHTRHVGIFYAENYSATLIGAGGIGAITAIALGKMGLGAITIFDTDTVDDVNIATQFYRLSDIGSLKVAATEKALQAYAGMQENVLTNSLRVGESVVTLPDDSIIISGVDSIKSRKGIYATVIDNWCAFPGPWRWYIDARMASEFLAVYVVNYNHRKWYEDTLAGQSDDDIPDEPCTSKATIYTGCIAAGVIGSIVRKIITGDQRPGILTYDIIKCEMLWLEMV